MNPDQNIEQHIRSFFTGHPVEEIRWTIGPIASALPDHRVLVVGPGPKSKSLTYITVGAWAARSDHRQEYLVIGSRPNDRYVELLSILSFYGIEHFLKPGDTVAIGQPLLPGSRCEHVYFSLPYPYGPELEICPVEGEDVHILWAFPITTPEKTLLLEHGVEELERRFERKAVKYWDPFRKSVV